MYYNKNYVNSLNLSQYNLLYYTHPSYDDVRWEIAYVVT